jgi:hypothetical protein
MIPMHDGVHLAADLYIPAEGEPDERLPVVMEYIPYRKDQVDLQARRFYRYLPRHGYIVVRVDVRGTGASEGVTVGEYVEEEQKDGYETVEWLARQSWCNGHVNMLGISYGGFTALQVATEAPPHLTSIIPVDFTDDRYRDECHYRGGLKRLYYNLAYYGAFMIAWNAMPPHPEWSGGSWAKKWERHMSGNKPYLLTWYQNQTDSPFWRHGSVRYSVERIRCPVFMIGGWRDGYMNSPLRLYRMLQVPKKVLIGPWNHAMPDAGIPGPRIDYLKEVVRWLDYWCKDRDTGVTKEPPVVVYMQESEPPVVDRLESKGHWRAESDWPAPGSSEKSLYLAGRRALCDQAGPDGSKELEYEPTVGICGGLFSGGIQFGLPGDQRPDEAYSLVFTTKPLEEDLHILGRPKAILHVASTASVIGFAASLSDVAADGSSHLVAKGMLNVTRRHSMEHPEPLVPGEIVELEIEIDCTGWVFKKGNRIRLSVANGDWPNVWPTPEAAMSRLYFGESRPSRLILPVVPPRGSATPRVFAPSPMKLARHGEAPYPPTWEVKRDVLTGRTTVNISVESAHRLTQSTVFERESKGIFEVEPSHPSHASGRGIHIIRLAGLNQQIESRSDVTIQATTTHFHVMIDLDVRLNDLPHFHRRWVESIERRLL